jgi:hypothetical protein
MKEDERDRTCSWNRVNKKNLEKVSLKTARRREDNTEIDVKEQVLVRLKLFKILTNSTVLCLWF